MSLKLWTNDINWLILWNEEINKAYIWAEEIYLKAFDITLTTYDNIAVSIPWTTNVYCTFTTIDWLKYYYIDNDTHIIYECDLWSPFDYSDITVVWSAQINDTYVIRAITISDDWKELQTFAAWFSYFLQFTFWTAWDITTLNTSYTHYLAFAGNAVTSIAYKPSWDKIIFWRLWELKSLDLAPNYDIDSNSNEQTYDFNTNDWINEFPTWIKITPDWLNLFLVTRSTWISSAIHHYAFWVAWDITSLNLEWSFDISSETLYWQGLDFSIDFSKIYIWAYNPATKFTYSTSWLL